MVLKHLNFNDQLCNITIGNWKSWIQLEKFGTFKVESDVLSFYLPINIQCSQHVGTSRLIFIANQLTGFYLTRTLVIYGLNTLFYLIVREVRL